MDVFGNRTINTEGCGFKLAKQIQSLLWFQLSVSTVCFTMEVIVLVILFSNPREPHKRRTFLKDAEEGAAFVEILQK